jgi:hypothetical protein
MSGARRGRLILVTSALMLAWLVVATAPADARRGPPPSRLVSFSASSLFPSFSPRIRNYVVRCDGGQVRVSGHAFGAWRAAIGNRRFRRGHLRRAVPLRAGRAFTVISKRPAQRRKHSRLYRYRVRCLPSDFPAYTFTRERPVSPQYFSLDPIRNSSGRYATIFNSRGVPLWWADARAQNIRVRPDGTILWFDLTSRRFELHRLNGSLVRTFNTVGNQVDKHDLRLLRNGDFLTGAYVRQQHVDTSAHGGSSDATVINAELQQVSPDGQLVWSWKSQDHVARAETGRHWPWVASHNYDLAHWNSIEPAGGSVIASFRHFDAVYKIRKSTGEIVWKLGGTDTPKSLTVQGDPRSYTLGAQHDARLLSNGTLTVFDNRTSLGNRVPRAARFRIDQTAGTATLLESVSDPDVPVSYCCGSARRLESGGWLIDWGKTGNNTGAIGGYAPGGERTFLMSFGSSYTYRAEPVPDGLLSARKLRRGMRAIYGPN